MFKDTCLVKSWYYKQILKLSDRVKRLVFKKNASKGLVSSPHFGCSVTIFRVILGNKMFLEGKMIIYINFSDYQSSRDLQLLKMFQFEKGNSFHPKTVVSHLKAAKPMYKADRIMVA